jgi:uncharacterized protein
MPSDDTIKQIKQIVKETDDSATVILYGSRARGDAKQDSDWDVLILVNKPEVSIKDEQVFRHRLYDLELKIGEPISTFVHSLHDWNNRHAQTPIYKRIQQEGKVL